MDVPWKLWYTDHSTYSWEDGPWIEAPARGVAALQYTDLTERVGSNIDTNHFYIWPHWCNHPYGADHWGLMDYLLEIGELSPDESLDSLSYQRLSDGGVKLGRMMQSKKWRELWDIVSHDPDFPTKNTAWPWERLPGR